MEPTFSVVLITGSTNVESIGFEVARQLSTGNYGVGVVILSGRNEQALSAASTHLKSLNSSAKPQSQVQIDTLLMDISSANSISSAVSHLCLNYPRLDVLINNAGVATPVSKKDKVEMFLKTEDTGMEDMVEVFRTNVAGVVELTNGVIDLLKESGKARVVNVSSQRGSLSFASSLEPARTGAMVYNTSKAALNMVTVMQAKNLPALVPGIIVNAASPGHVSTPFNKFTGHRSLFSGAGIVVHLATLPAGAESGKLFGDHPPFSEEGKFVKIPW